MAYATPTYACKSFEPSQDHIKNCIEWFVVMVQQKTNDHYTVNLPNSTPPKYTVKFNKKYAKVTGGGSVHSFIDMTTGDVLKPASYNAPAKHPRGNVTAPDNGHSALDDHGRVKYLR